MTGVALVVGASGGVGSAVVRRLVADGFSVVAGSRSTDAGERDGALWRAIDAQADASVRSAVDAACALGELRAVICCQGVVRSTPLDDFDDDELGTTLDVNLRGTARVCRAIADRIADGGAVVTFSSVGAHRASAGNRFAYGASKAAVEALTRSYAVGLAGRGVRVNTIIPGPLDQPMAGTPRQAGDQAFVASVRSRVPLGRAVTVVEVAAAVSFLVSSAASGITGVALPVDGGLLAR